MEQSNEERISKGLGWVYIGKSADGKQVVEMLREKIDIWHPKKDKILRIINVEQDKPVKGLWQQMNEGAHIVEYNISKVTMDDILNQFSDIYKDRQLQPHREPTLILPEKEYMEYKNNPEKFMKMWEQMVIQICEEGGLI